MLFGALINLIGLGWLYNLTQVSAYYIYIIALFIGFSQTLILSTAINLISDVIGTKTKSGAFVFGVYSLFDKISAGLILYWLGNS